MKVLGPDRCDSAPVEPRVRMPLTACSAAEQHRESAAAGAGRTNRQQAYSGQRQLGGPYAAVQADLAQQPRRGNAVTYQVDAGAAVNRRPVSP
jgi:hypothetical protein